MNWNDWAGGLIFGFGIGWGICARLNLRRARRTAAAIREMVE